MVVTPNGVNSKTVQNLALVVSKLEQGHVLIRNHNTVAENAMVQQLTRKVAICTHVLLMEVTHHSVHGTNVPNPVVEEPKSVQELARTHLHNTVVRTVEDWEQL